MSDDQGTISPGGKHPEQRILIDRLQPLTAGYIANIAAIQHAGYYNKFDSTKSLGVYY